MNTTDTRIHSFSRKLAKEYGDTEALLLSYLGYKIAHSQQHYDNRTWYFESLDELARRYPYLSRSAIHNALTKLSGMNGPLIVGNYNKRGYDRTKWYAFRDNQTQRHLQAQPIYFRIDDAERYGVVEAVLLMNLAYWIRKNRLTKPDYQYHQMSAHSLSQILPYSESAIKRALRHLTEEDGAALVSRRPIDGRAASEYGFASETELQKYGMEGIAGGSNLDKEDACLNMGGPNLDLTGPNVDLSGPEVDLAGPKVNDYTILIDSHLKDSCFEEKSLKDRNFQSGSVSDSNSQSNGSILDRVSTATLVPPSNLFAEPVVGETKVGVDTNLSALASLARAAATVNQLASSSTRRLSRPFSLPRSPQSLPSKPDETTV